MAVSTYDPSQVTVSFGPVLISGFSEDSVVSIERNEDSYTLQMGVDGHGTRTRTSNKSARVTVSLMQSSMANDLLSAISILDEQSGQGVYPLMVKDGSGRSLHAAESAWIVRPANAAYSKTAQAREWIFETAQMNSHVGGN